MTKICLSTNTYLAINIFIFLIITCIISGFYFYKVKDYERMNQFCQKKIEEVRDLLKLTDKPQQTEIQIQQPIKITKHTPLEILPERRYIGPHDYDFQPQQVGFIYDTEGQRFPLYENRRGNKYYYHIKDSSRNGIRIVIETQAYRQLNDGEVINIPELANDFTIKLYEYSGNKYNPFVY